MGKDKDDGRNVCFTWEKSMILGGDVGGTKTNLATFERQGRKLRKIHERKFPSHEARSFGEMLRAFVRGLDSGVRFEAACFGVAGPVIDSQVHPTNLPWSIEADAAAEILNTRRVLLINDMEATFAGIDALEPEEVVLLQKGKAEPHATQALIAAGTGLGESFRVWKGDGYLVIPSEGGHSDFAPRTEQEIELLQFLKKEQTWVDGESIISGRGFHRIHRFLGPSVDHPDFHGDGEDPAAEITHRALAGACSICVATVELWVRLYGAEAGNLALKTLARGGVFVAGGIAAKILPEIRGGGFVEAFSQKADLADLLSTIPITVALNEQAALVGAAASAAALLEPGPG
jgi:glucokinase